jgi:hypothetical protein
VLTGVILCVPLVDFLGAKLFHRNTKSRVKLLTADISSFLNLELKNPDLNELIVIVICEMRYRNVNLRVDPNSRAELIKILSMFTGNIIYNVLKEVISISLVLEL